MGLGLILEKRKKKEKGARLKELMGSTERQRGRISPHTKCPAVVKRGGIVEPPRDSENSEPEVTGGREWVTVNRDVIEKRQGITMDHPGILKNGGKRGYQELNIAVIP